MNYTNEELEQQVEGAIQTCRRLASKYKSLESGYIQLSHQYHIMMNLYNPDKHTSPTWRDCDQQPCKEASHLLSILSGGGDSVKLNRLEERISNTKSL